MNEFDLKKFATRLIALRKETGHKKKEIADKLGVIPQTYIRYELGQRHASLDFVVKAAQLFNVSVDYLLGTTDVRNKSESQNNKPCPFCGQKEYLTIGTTYTPDGFWDGGMRGEHYDFIKCSWCDLIMKKDDKDELIRDWNKRGEP